MATAVRVGCVNGKDRLNAHGQIEYVGGVSNAGGRWKLTQEQAILGIEEGTWDLYVERVPGKRMRVVVAVNPQGRKHLKTEADGDESNNLLSLPECPRSAEDAKESLDEAGCYPAAGATLVNSARPSLDSRTIRPRRRYGYNRSAVGTAAGTV